MKNNKWIRKYSKVFCGILAAAMVMASLTACGDGEAASGTNSEVTQESTVQAGTESSTATQERDTMEDAVTYMGEITAIDGYALTIALTETPDNISLPQDANGEPVIPEGKLTDEISPREQPDGEASTRESSAVAQSDDETPASQAPNPEKPAGEAPSGEAPQGQAPGNGEGGRNGAPEMELQLTGETITVTADENTIITVDGQEASLADMEVGNTVTVIMQGEKVNSIMVGFAPQGERLKPEEKLEDKKPGATEAEEIKPEETKPEETELQGTKQPAK